ncbi:MAG: HAD family hydrolase [Rickettsiaceae bacterium H1]|nr:HAD family hydrolase [Rickettsiaceae bacterium H1]
MLPEAIIFDWDNTLVDVQSSLDFALEQTMIEMKYDAKQVKNDRKSYTSRNKFLQGKFKNGWKKANEIYDKYIKLSPVGGVSLFKHAKEVLDFAVDNQILMVIVSNKFGTDLRSEIAQLKLSDYFVSIIGSGDTNEDKPSAIPAQKALAEVRLKLSKKIWFVGDSISDMECARKLGVLRVFYGESNIDDIITDLHVQNHYNLLTLLQESS